MIFGVLIPAAILGTIALLIVLVVQRARGGIELSPRALLRLYLYIASLAGVVVFTIGLASVVNYGLARAVSNEFIYGGNPPIPAIARPTCPPEAVAKGCLEPPQQAELERQSRDRRRDEDLIRGITFSLFGVLFWGAHWMARRGLGDDVASNSLRRGYLMLGTVVFGLATIALLPTGIYQALANVLLQTPQNFFRQGADALGGGLVSLPIWLIYLRLVVTEFRQTA